MWVGAIAGFLGTACLLVFKIEHLTDAWTAPAACYLVVLALFLGAVRQERQQALLGWAWGAAGALGALILFSVVTLAWAFRLSGPITR